MPYCKSTLTRDHPLSLTSKSRRQSAVLVAIAVPLLAAMSLQWLVVLGLTRLSITLGIASLTFAAIVWVLRAATPAAALTGGVICFLIGLGISPAGLVPLITLFVLTFLATRVGKRQKAAAGLPEPDIFEARHGRATSQVIANLGVAAFIASGFFAFLIDRHGPPNHLTGPSLWPGPLLVVAALAQATADTLSSELGQAFGGTPRMLLTGKSVPPGTDGAITLLGTAAGIFGAAIVTATATFALHFALVQSFIALAAATFGLFFDSLLGATLERRAYLNNDLVNFLGTLSAALAAAVLYSALF